MYKIMSTEKILVVGSCGQLGTELVEALRSMPKGKAIRVKDLALDPKSEDYKNDKASTSAVIRSAGKQAGVEVSIQWSSTGVPQVTVKTPKVKAKK